MQVKENDCFPIPFCCLLFCALMQQLGNYPSYLETQYYSVLFDESDNHVQMLFVIYACLHRLAENPQFLSSFA